MNLFIENKNIGEIICSLNVKDSCLQSFTDNIYCYNNRGYKILSMPQLYIRVHGSNIDCNFILREVIRKGDIIIIIGEKDGIKYKLSFKKGEVL